MECDQCGARRPRSGPCPECGAPAPGTYSSMRGWKDQSRTGQGPAVGRGSGTNWKGAGSSSRLRSPRNDWDEGGYEEDPPARSSAGNRRRPGYEDVERALVPSANDMLPMDPAAMGMTGGVGLPAYPGLPQTDEEERAIGIRRPVYIPATGEKRKKKLGTWRVLSGVVSVMLICVASCGLAALFGRDQLAKLLNQPIHQLQPIQAYSTAGVPVTPVATPGPQQKYVTILGTSQGVDGDFTAINRTSHFTVGQPVYVICTVRGLAKGQRHLLSIHWFYDGTDMEVPMKLDQTEEPLTSDVVIYFDLPYPQPGVGMAEVFLDLPSSVNGDEPNNPYLAGKITFAIDPPGVGYTTPTVGSKTPSAGSATPKPTGTSKAG